MFARWLPLWLLAGMLATALVIEGAWYGTLLWQTKLPLALLLLRGLAGPRRPERA